MVSVTEQSVERATVTSSPQAIRRDTEVIDLKGSSPSKASRGELVYDSFIACLELLAKGTQGLSGLTGNCHGPF